MPLTVRFIGGPRAGETIVFGDDAARISFGRDHTRCDVVVPATYQSAGRHHFAVRPGPQGYVFEIDGEHAVLADGTEVRDGQPLSGSYTDVELGTGGARLRLEVPSAPLPETKITGTRGEAGAVPPGRTTLLLRDLGNRLRSQRRLTMIALCAALAAAAGAVTLTVVDIRGDRYLRSTIERARASVYLVIIETEGLGMTPVGTAWVVPAVDGPAARRAGRNLLATNAHVAEHFEKLGEGQRLIVRSSDTPPKSFTVIESKIHPGYRAFEETWVSYDPTVPDINGTLRSVQHVMAYDVALLRVPDSADLAPPLPLVPAAEIVELGLGDSIGLVGHPLENMTFQAQSVKQPNPTVSTGEIRKLTDFFFENPAGGGFELLSHSVDTVRGSSGSPVLRFDGKVVAIHSAGNAQYGASSSVAAVSPVNYAQSVEFLRELLEARADGATLERRPQWCKKLAGYARRNAASPNLCAGSDARQR